MIAVLATIFKVLLLVFGIILVLSLIIAFLTEPIRNKKMEKERKANIENLKKAYNELLVELAKEEQKNSKKTTKKNKEK